MSVGGRVTWTRDLGPTIEIATWEEDSPGGDFVAIRAEKNITIMREMKPGDVVWWQGQKAFWTPKGGPLDGEEDIEMTKVTNSYSVSDKEARKMNTGGGR